jgi:hypothetical protein
MIINSGASADGAIVQGGNTAIVAAAGADAQVNTDDSLLVQAWLKGFNGTTWDRLRALADNADGVAVATLGILLADARLKGFNGTTWDRIRSLSATSLNGLGQLCFSGAVPGAGVVLGARVITVANTIRQTMITPTVGKRIRIISCALGSGGTVTGIEVYFGTGANIDTTPANAIVYGRIIEGAAGIYAQNPQFGFGDGSGPVGAVDAVVSQRNDSSIANHSIIIHYREE